MLQEGSGGKRGRQNIPAGRVVEKARTEGLAARASCAKCGQPTSQNEVFAQKYTGKTPFPSQPLGARINERGGEKGQGDEGGHQKPSPRPTATTMASKEIRA